MSFNYYTAQSATNHANVPCSVCEDSSGNLHALWFNSPSNCIAYYAKSTDGGQTWTDGEGGGSGTDYAVKTISSNNLYYPKIVVDSLGYIHCWYYDGNTGKTCYRRRTSSWQSENATFSSFTFDLTPLLVGGACVDGSDRISVFYLQSGNTKQLCSRDNGATWDAAITVGGSTSQIRAVTARGSYTYVLISNTSSDPLVYRGSYSGSWSWSSLGAAEATTFNGRGLCLIDSSDNIYIFYEPTSGGTLRYCKYSGSWGSPKEVLASIANTTYLGGTINSDNRIFLSYTDGSATHNLYLNEFDTTTEAFLGTTEIGNTAKDNIGPDMPQYVNNNTAIYVFYHQNTEQYMECTVETLATTVISDINNDFRASVLWYLYYINNDVRIASGTVYSNINNDIRFGGVNFSDVANDIRFVTINYIVANVNNDIRIRPYYYGNIANKFETLAALYQNVSNNLKIRAQGLSNVNNDLRLLFSWQKAPGGTLESLGKGYVTVSIDSVDQPLVNVDSIKINEQCSESVKASFLIAVPYDTTPPVIGKEVIIKYSTYTIFKGYVSGTSYDSKNEGIMVECQDLFWLNNQSTVGAFGVGHEPVDNKVYVGPNQTPPNGTYISSTVNSEGIPFDIYQIMKYYPTIAEAMALVGGPLVGNFVPDNISIGEVGKSDAIVTLLQEAGNYGVFYKNGLQYLHINGTGNNLDIPIQTLGNNFNLHQVISYSIGTSKDKIVNTAKVYLGSTPSDIPAINNHIKLQ